MVPVGISTVWWNTRPKNKTHTNVCKSKTKNQKIMSGQRSFHYNSVFSYPGCFIPILFYFVLRLSCTTSVCCASKYFLLIMLFYVDCYVFITFSVLYLSCLVLLLVFVCPCYLVPIMLFLYRGCLVLRL